MITVKPGEVSDCEFLTKCVIEAEKGHGSVGIWNLMISDDVQLAAVISHAMQNDKASHFHFSRFLILRNEQGIPVAGGCAFPSPPCGLFESKDGLCNAMISVFKCSEEEANKRWNNGVHFLLEAYPDINWENTWVIDCLYTIPAYRGQGHGKTLLNALYELGRKNPLCRVQHQKLESDSEVIDDSYSSDYYDRSLLACVVGNESARSLYVKNGYVESLGAGFSDKCTTMLGYSGFEMLCRRY